MLKSRVEGKPFFCVGLKGLAILGAFALWAAGAAQAQVPDAGTLSREIQRDLSRLQQEEKVPAATASAPAAQKESVPEAVAAPPAQGPIPVWEAERLPPEDQIMATPFRRIYVRAPLFKEKVVEIVRGEIIEKNQLRAGALASIRSQVWNLYLQHSRLASINFKIIPVAGSDSDSYMRVEVEEVRRNKIIIQDNTPQGLSAAARAQIENSIAGAFEGGDLLNLEGLDARLKHRLRLGDYDMQIGLVPVDPAIMDVKVTVTGKQLAPADVLLQYDNTGTRSFGRDRVIMASSFNQLSHPGDRLDVTLMKSVDIAKLDGEGVAFARADYDVPVSVAGLRVKGWGSAMHYSAAPRVAANSQAEGQAFEFGLGLMKPLVTGKQGLLDLQVDFIEKFVRDRFDENIVTGDKMSHNGRIKLSGAAMLDPTQIVRAGLTLTTGSVDLSGLASALAADRAGPKANGLYTKLEAEASWQKIWDDEQRGDIKINLRGQTTAMNLDSMEKFSLGGMSGLRAFGSGEASGDSGGLAQIEFGYRVYENMRASLFYDVGAIWRNFDPYETNATAPNSYMLQDVGFGLGYAVGPFSASVLFAQQIGPNPGLSAAGRDADNGTRESRILTTLSYAF